MNAKPETANPKQKTRNPFMAVKKIIIYPKDEAALRKKSEPVRTFNRRTKKLINNLKDTLAKHPEGIGLAAPQINVHQQVAIVRLGGKSGDEEREPDPPIALINPQILEADNDKPDFDGCLSIPGIFGTTVRPHTLRVSGTDEEGRPFDRIFEGFDAVVVHHEIDHLQGVLFIDRVKSVKDLYRIEEDENGKFVRVPIVED